MTLNPENRNDIVSYRLEKANDTMQQVHAISRLGYWTLVANRLYYAVYYACSALLIANGIEVSTHKGVIKQIGQSFILPGTLPVTDAKLLNKLFSMRQSGDYEDLFDWDEADVAPLISQVEDFIMRIIDLIESSKGRL
ncbi:MAG: HEPN domain-containing protein [Muribaculaceae bacterium]|nr:HEPN domain-containing protein [Muribaculaceae bacterium]